MQVVKRGKVINVTVALIKRGNLDMGRTTNENEGSECGAMATSQGTPKTVNKPPETRTEANKRLSSQPLEDKPMLPTTLFQTLVSRTVRE